LLFSAKPKQNIWRFFPEGVFSQRRPAEMTRPETYKTGGNFMGFKPEIAITAFGVAEPKTGVIA
jgi:hypothetical protein